MVRNMRSPIRWFGGKGNMQSKILKLFPSHKQYVEVFGGGASLLFAKEPVALEVYNDLNSDLVNFFRVLRDPEKFQRLVVLLELTPYSREEFYNYRDTYAHVEDDFTRAYMWYVVNLLSFGGECASWSVCRSGIRNNALKFNTVTHVLRDVCNRLRCVQIDQQDFRKLIPAYDKPGTLLYCDPPYVKSTRSSGSYRHEMSDQDHIDLIDTLIKYPEMVVLSGYQNEIYKKLERYGWQRIDFETACYAAGRTKASGIQGKGSALKKQKRTESVWRNPKCLLACGELKRRPH